MGCLAFDISSNDDILNSLSIGSIGDMVIYRGERYKWGGISVDSVGPFVNEQYVTLTQDAKGKNGISITKVLLKKNKHLRKREDNLIGSIAKATAVGAEINFGKGRLTKRSLQ